MSQSSGCARLGGSVDRLYAGCQSPRLIEARHQNGQLRLHRLIVLSRATASDSVCFADRPPLSVLSVSAFHLCFPHFSAGHRNASHCISRIDNTLGPLAKLFVVYTFVIGGDQDEIETRNCAPAPFYRLLAGEMRMLTSRLDHRHVG